MKTGSILGVLFLCAFTLIGGIVVWAQVPPNIARTDGGDHIDKLIALLAYLRATTAVTGTVLHFDTTTHMSVGAGDQLLKTTTIPQLSAAYGSTIKIRTGGKITGENDSKTITLLYEGIPRNALDFKWLY